MTGVERAAPGEPFDVAALRADFLRLLSQVNEEVVLAGEVLLEGRVEHVGPLADLDRRVDAAERALEERCLDAFSRPAGEADLRLVALVYKSLSDLERAGDYAVHVARDARLFALAPPARRLAELRRILASVKTMLAWTAQAFTEGDANRAGAAVRLDLDVDERHDQFYRELVTFLREHPQAVPEAVALMRIGRSLQRIGDHVENVSERLAAWLEAGPD